MPDATGLELIAHELRDANPEAILGTEEVLSEEMVAAQSRADGAINLFPGGDTAGA